MYIFNNCHNRPHAAMYGSGAFFDLDTVDFQERVARRLANELTVSETCIVASLDITGDITFDWYKFSRENLKRDNERNVNCHVYFGRHFKTETLSRSDAIQHGIYGQFFNVDGHFKRLSVMRGR